MNIVLLVVDSLRASALSCNGSGARTPFLDALAARSTYFARAYATECWTLPTHLSLFTGQLPSEHGAHFRTMAYRSAAPTIAELAAEAGYETEIVTRNFVFDGTMPGVIRGFRRNTRVLAETRRLNPFAIYLALAKPRFRRHIRSTGFFHPHHRQSREFLRSFALALEPADDRALGVVLQRMRDHRRAGRRHFTFANLYDVHAPYPPRADSILRSWRSLDGWKENLAFPSAMSALGAHRYLRRGFRLSEYAGRMLRARYEAAIALMDEKLRRFVDAARAEDLLDDTVLIITSDHGEAFGEHDLYLHDASVYDTHLHVPLWLLHPARLPATVTDIVSTRHLVALMKAVIQGTSLDETILADDHRGEHAVAVAEHFPYPHLPDALPLYRQDLVAVIAGRHKVIARGDQLQLYDIVRDPGETAPEPATVADFVTLSRQHGVSRQALTAAVARLEGRQRRAAA